MKVRKILSALLCLGLLLTILAGCGGASNAAADRAPMEAPALKQEMENSMAADTALGSAAPDGSTALPENRKWVITMHMNTETEDLTAMLKAVDEKILSLGGYVEDQNIHNGSKYANRRYRNASLTVRIPAEKVDDFTGTMEEISNVVNTEKNLEDITLAYVSTESRLKALQTEEERLLELMAQAEDMSDLLTIEARLTEVRYQLENAASKLRIYDNQVDYATIYLSIEEVLQYTPVAEKTVWERISDGFGNSLENLGEGLVDFFVWVVVSSPYLVLWGAILGGAVFLAIRLNRKKKAKEAPVNIPWQEKQPEDKKETP